MRIGMMLDAYKPHVSGITNYVELNKRALEQLGHEVFVFTFGDVDYQDDESNVIRSPGLPLTDTGFFCEHPLQSWSPKDLTHHGHRSRTSPVFIWTSCHPLL
jgi:hypothetical protein